MQTIFVLVKEKKKKKFFFWEFWEYSGRGKFEEGLGELGIRGLIMDGFIRDFKSVELVTTQKIIFSK